MPRHQLTTEDRRKAAAATNAWLKKCGHRYKLTQDDRRRGGLATAAKRRAERAAKLFGVSYKDLEVQVLAADPAVRAALFCGCTPDGPSLACQAEGLWHGPERAAALTPEPAINALPDLPLRPGAPCIGTEDPGECSHVPDCRDVKAMAEKLMSGGGAKLCGICKRPLDVPGDPDSTNCGGDCRACTEEVERDNPPMMLEEEVQAGAPNFQIQAQAADAMGPSDDALIADPFTLSALKRFRLGPLSPLALTRSQRAHVDIMLAGGWVEKTPEAMIRLTAKGEAALNATENE